MIGRSFRFTPTDHSQNLSFRRSPSKQIFKLERGLGFQVFKHSHQIPELTEAGRVFIVESREVVSHAERAVLSARAVLDGPNEILNIGKSSYTEPILVSTLLSIQLSLFPEMRIKLWSNFSNELALQVGAGTLDLAVITGVPHKPQLSVLNIADNPFYIAMRIGDELSGYREVRLEQMHKRNWMLLGKHANAHLYDTIHSVGAERGASPADIYHFTSPEEASELIREHHGLAFLPCSAAWRIARDGITMRPLAESRLRSFFAAFGTDKKPRCMHPTFNLFSAELAVAIQTNMNM